jgi:hypothetical protein
MYFTAATPPNFYTGPQWSPWSKSHTYSTTKALQRKQQNATLVHASSQVTVCRQPCQLNKLGPEGAGRAALPANTQATPKKPRTLTVHEPHTNKAAPSTARATHKGLESRPCPLGPLQQTNVQLAQHEPTTYFSLCLC